MELQQCNNPSSSSLSKADRKTIEKNRRNQMKALYLKLNSLVPRHASREVVSLPDQLEEATNYIKKLQIDLEGMTQRKDRLTGDHDQISCSRSSCGRLKEGLLLPHIEIHNVDSALEVVLITGLDHQLMFNHIIRILHEEGVEVINASYSVIGDTILHSIHSMVGECTSGYGAARISGRLKKFLGTGAS